MSNLPPPARMAHIGQAKPALSTCTAHVFHASKPGLEIRRHCIGAWTGIFGTEIKVVTMPFGVKINNIVPLRILERGLNVFWLQDVVYQRHCLCLYSHLDRIRYYGLRWAINPRLCSHRILKIIYCLQTIRNNHPITDNSLIFYQLILSLLMEG